jgi:hypothetical protein
MVQTMNESYRRILFVALFAVVLFQTGAHISQSFVNYPAWEFIDRSSFPAYHRVMTAGAFLFLMIPRLVEIVLALVVLRFRPAAIERWMLALSIGLAVGALLCTAFVQRPIHWQLETMGNTAELLSQLRTTDWIRLVPEILRAAIYLWMLSLVGNSPTGCTKGASAIQ